MERDYSTYLQRLAAEYSKFEESKLSRFIERSGTRAVEAEPEKFLEHRKAIRIKDKERALKPYGNDESMPPGRDVVRETLGALEILNDISHPRTLLLADPGMGKTALLWVMARRDADAFLAAPQDGPPLPVRFDLRSGQRHWTEGGRDNLIRLIGERLAGMGLFPSEADPVKSFRELASTQRLRLLLDGMNEVEGKRREDLVAELESLAREMAATRIEHFMAVSSRVREGVARLSGFDCAELEPLSGKDVEAYAHEAMGGQAKNFLAQVKTRRLDRLAGIPLFLRLLAELHLAPKTSEIPPNRAGSCKRSSRRASWSPTNRTRWTARKARPSPARPARAWRPSGLPGPDRRPGRGVDPRRRGRGLRAMGEG